MKPLPLGEIFAARYELQELVGAGGMGAVYRALDRELGEVVALKLLHPVGGIELAGEALERFRREVRVARRVTHRNVCRTFDLGDADGVHYLTMEYVAGQSLEALLEEHVRLDPARTALVAQQICMGLAAAHDAGVIHRDLKPANVLLGSDGRVVLTDFGIARPVDVASDSIRTLGAIGTPAYMAPEQVSGGTVDARTDLYALGALMFEMLTGSVPFTARTPFAVALARLDRAAPDPRGLAPIPDALAELVQRLLERDPTRRPASAREVEALLARFAGTGAMDPSATAAPTMPGSAILAATESGRSRRPTAPATEASLAVLPFEYRGPPEYEYLASGIREALIDTLSMTRGLRVLARGATAKLGTGLDPREIGAALGVETIVDGSVRGSAEHLRVTARLVRVSTGAQIWSERFDGRVEDAFSFEDRMSRRVAEALRMPLTAVAPGTAPPAEAVHLYFRARRHISEMVHSGPEGAVELLERCLALAPSFAPAVASHAVACVRRWYVPLSPDMRAVEVAARQSVERALIEAPDVAETHLAAGMLAAQVGEYGQTGRALERALEIAPTCAEALEYLGGLLVEAGRIDEGFGRLREAVSLDPTLTAGLVHEARCFALQGDREGFTRKLAELERSTSPNHVLAVQLRARVSIWSGDLDGVPELLQRLTHSPVASVEAIGALVRFVLGETDFTEAEAWLRGAGSLANPRFLSYLRQLAAEALAFRNELDAAEAQILTAADGILADLIWMDLCPVLAPLRSRRTFQQARGKVQVRADQVWRR